MTQKDTCEIYCYDEEKVNRIQGELKAVEFREVAQLFKAIADENRAKITYALCQDEELCVCDIANIIGITVANASHHLRTPHKQGIVTYRKKGKLVFYSLDNSRIRLLLSVAINKKEVEQHV